MRKRITCCKYKRDAEYSLYLFCNKGRAAFIRRASIRYFPVIPAVTVSLALLCVFYAQTVLSERNAAEEGAAPIRRVCRRITDNTGITRGRSMSLNEHYASHTRVLAKMTAGNSGILSSPSWMERIASLLLGDGIHATDEEGILG